MSLSRTKTECISWCCQHFISFPWNNSLSISLVVSYLSVPSQYSWGDLRREMLNQYLSLMQALEKPWIQSWGPKLPWTQPRPTELAAALEVRPGPQRLPPCTLPRVPAEPKVPGTQSLQMPISCPQPPPPYPETWGALSLTGSEVGINGPEFCSEHWCVTLSK